MSTKNWLNAADNKIKLVQIFDTAFHLVLINGYLNLVADALPTEPRTNANLQANYKHNDLDKCMIYNGIHYLYDDTVLEDVTMLSRRHNGACIVDEILMQQRLYAGITGNSG